MATTIWPSSAVVWGRTTTLSPLRMPAPTMLSPRTRRAKQLGSSQGMVPSWFSMARMGRPAVTMPMTGICPWRLPLTRARFRPLTGGC